MNRKHPTLFPGFGLLALEEGLELVYETKEGGKEGGREGGRVARTCT